MSEWACLSVSACICLSVCLYVPVCLSTCLSVPVCLCLSVCLPVCGLDRHDEQTRLDGRGRARAYFISQVEHSGVTMWQEKKQNSECLEGSGGIVVCEYLSMFMDLCVYLCLRLCLCLGLFVCVCLAPRCEHVTSLHVCSLML